MNKAEKILTALQNHLNIKNYRLLAEHFGINKTLIYSWVKHGNITQTGKILAKLPYISLDWLETGEGPMMADQIKTDPGNQTIIGTKSIQAGRSINGQQTIGGGDHHGIELVLDDDEKKLILLSREVGGKMMLRKFIDDLEQLKKLIERQI